jgi:pentapeptide repeat protein
MRYVTFGEAELLETNLSEADLEEADFIHATLSGTDLRKANLKNAVFSSPANWVSAHLTAVNFQEANLEEVDFRGVCLRGINFRTANLAKAHLEDTDLSGALLQGANLTQTHLERARLNETDLEGLDLSTAYLEEPKFQYFEDPATTLRVALRNSKLYKKCEVPKAWSTEFIYGHTYTRTVSVNEDGTVTFDRIFTEPHPYEPGNVYRCTNETFLSIEDLISHIQENQANYQDVRPDDKEWHF